MQTFKAPPHSLEMERAVLGAALLSAEALETICAALKPDELYRNGHQVILRQMKALHAKDEPVDIVTLVEAIGAAGELEKVEGAAYVASLTGEVPSLAHVEHYAMQLTELARRRRVIEAAHKLAYSASDRQASLDSALAAFDTATVSRDDGKGAQPIAAYLAPALDELERRYIGEKPPGVPTGLECLDRSAPLAPGDLFVLAGRPGMGKSALAFLMALGAAQQGARVLFFSLEMQADQVTSRLMAKLSGIPLPKFRSGKLAESDFPKVSAAATRLQPLPLFIDERPGLTIAQIKAEAAKLKRKGGLDLIFIDHLGKIRPDNPNASEYSRATDTVRAAKDLARALHIPVVLLSQLSRRVESRVPPMPATSDLRDSGAIEEEADSIAFIYRQDYYVNQGLVVPGKQERGQPAAFDPSLAGKALVRLAKNRHGPTLQFKLDWIPEQATFKEIPQ